MKAIKLFGLRNYIQNNIVLLPINANQIKTIAVDFSYNVTESEFNKWQFIFGSRTTKNYKSYNAFGCVIRYDRLWLNIGSIDETTNIPISVGRHHIEYKNDFDKKLCSINLDNKYTIDATITNYVNYNIGFYSTSHRETINQSFLGTIYKIHIVKTDNTSIDFVPAKYNGKFGFIDESLLETDISSNEFYEESIGGLRPPKYNLQIPEGNVTKIEDKEGNILWTNN